MIILLLYGSFLIELHYVTDTEWWFLTRNYIIVGIVVKVQNESRLEVW